jgi:flagella basal body P-ring formation protein FlgA
VFLDVWTEVAAAARPINRREALGPQMVTHVRKNLAYLSGDVWDGTGGPWQVKRPIGRDQVIYRSNLEPLPLVRRGETVRLVYEGENIRLETLAEALEDGGAGQAIAVMNLDSEREITATVRDSGTVYVQ